MPSLTDALERFNRKERNLLVRHVLSYSKSPPALDPTFCKQLKQKLNLRVDVPTNSHWWTDYHISWLAGALAIFTRGEAARKQTWTNKPADFTNTKDHREISRYISEGNQEDVDLLIAFKNCLIIVEVKAYGGWDTIQLQSKLTRLKLIDCFYERELRAEKDVKFHFLLLSRNKLKEDKEKKLDGPSWIRHNSSIPWMKLKSPFCDDKILEVGRCTKEGDRKQDRGSLLWGIYRLHGKKLEKGHEQSDP